MKISIEGIPELEKALADKTSEMHGQLVEAVEEAARAVRDDARQLVPRDTGTLHDGIGYTTDGPTAEVGVLDSTLHYGAFVEFGTSKMPARPFMAPAGELERARFVKRLKDAVR
jgi:HK97 gp10 family phage protein